MSTIRHGGARVFVTGAGSGLGRAIAHRFALEGAAAVTVVDREADRVRKVLEELSGLGVRAVPVVADLGESAECERALTEAISAMGGLDVCISNAAISSSGEMTVDMTLESWQRMIAVNLTAYFLLGRLSARHMRENGGGSILFTASVGGTWGQPGGAHYSVTKAAVINLVKTMALEYGPMGIRVNAVSPGGMDTNMIPQYQGEEVAARMRAGSASAALGRIAAPEEVAAAFSWLASSESSFVTGVNLLVDGGVSAGVPPKLEG